MTNDQFEIFGYTLTDDPEATRELNHITPEVDRILNEIHDDVPKGKKYLLKRLPRLIKQFPKVPIFKNHLSVVYEANGDIEQAFATINKVVQEHPGLPLRKDQPGSPNIYTKKNPKRSPEFWARPLSSRHSIPTVRYSRSRNF